MDKKTKTKNKQSMDLKNNDSYIASCVKVAEEKLSKYKDITEIEKEQETINAYENIGHLEEPKDVYIIDSISKDELDRAKKCVLDGRFFAEHAAAGEATRLGLGTKYHINIRKHLSTNQISKLISEEKGVHVSEEQVLKEGGCRPEELHDICLGTRHMLQYSFDIFRLAKEEGVNPEEALKKQKMLIILNETSAENLIEEFISLKFFGFSQENILFMVQKSYHGIKKMNGKCIYDKTTPKRLHNHGQMVMQETMDDEIFYIGKKGNRIYLKSAEFGEILKEMDDKLSYNIEDLGFLVSAIDYESLAVALRMSDLGYRMVMEIVGNNPENPQKGGMGAFDKKLGRNVMIEAFQLSGIKNSDIKFLNKNFNHYPKPYDSWIQLKEYGLNMPITIKHDLVYFQAVQGDINFLVKTQFVQRKTLKPIQSWKSPATTPLTMKYMKMQDEQIGFKEYAKRTTGINI